MKNINLSKNTFLIEYDDVCRPIFKKVYAVRFFGWSFVYHRVCLIKIFMKCSPILRDTMLLVEEDI